MGNLFSTSLMLSDEYILEISEETGCKYFEKVSTIKVYTTMGRRRF
jgi:hypothetical protein